MLSNLKKLRTEKGISQKALGEAVQVSQQSINKYENHNVIPDINTLIAMANYFDTSIDYLVGNTDIQKAIQHTSKYDLNDDEKNLIDVYRNLNKKNKKSIHLIINTMAEK